MPPRAHGTTGSAATSGPGRGQPGEDALALICFSGQDWWYHNRAHSDFQLMVRVAQTLPVLLVNSITMRMPLPGRSTQALRRIARKARSLAKRFRQPFADGRRFYVLTPLIVPFYGLVWARRFNAWLVRRQVERVARRLGIQVPVLFVTIPTAWDVVRHMDRALLVFNRSDKSSEFSEAEQRYVRDQEQGLLAGSDLVLYVSRTLMAEEQDLTGGRARFLDHGVDLELFAPRDAPEPADLRAIPHPRIGFFGGFDDYVVDFELLEQVATAIPEAQLVLIGHATCSMKRFERLPNVHWLGHKPHEEIPAYGRGFDVALMPWLDSEWIRNCNPIKMKEYLALGLPVVSTSFPEVRRYQDLIRVAEDRRHFVELVRKTLVDGGLASAAERRRRVADASWEAKVRQLQVWLAEARGTG